MLTLGIHTHLDHPRIRYTLDFLRQHPLTQQADVQIFLNNAPLTNDLNISYGTTTESVDFVIPAQGVFFVEKIAGGPFYANRYTSPAETVYSVETRPSPSNRPLLMDRVFQFDLLETIFFHVSRYEEVFAGENGKQDSGWLEESRHLLIRTDLQQIPIVDRLIATFLELIVGRAISIPTSYDLTHDVDFLYRYPSFRSVLKSMAGTIYRRESLSHLRLHPQTYLKVRKGQQSDPYDCFEWLLSAASGWQQKTLYLMAGGETAHDNHYRIEDPKVRALISLAENRGYTLGFHPSYNAGFKPTLFKREKLKLEEILGRPVTHSRQHWLRWNWSVTPYLIDQFKISEDASLGYRQHLGFRAGTGFPYHLYDFRSETPFEWWERPLALMESAALHEARSAGTHPINLLQSFLDRNPANTHISVNFHNSNFDPTLSAGKALATFYQNKILMLAG